MKPAKIALIVLAALAAASMAYAQTVYRWVDKDGKVHYSDSPPIDVDATQKRVGGGSGDDTQLPYATQMAMKRSPVTLYTSSRCGEICTSGRDLLVKRGIPYSERNPEGNPADLEALKKLVGTPEVPVLGTTEETTEAVDNTTEIANAAAIHAKCSCSRSRVNI